MIIPLAPYWTVAAPFFFNLCVLFFCCFPNSLFCLLFFKRKKTTITPHLSIFFVQINDPTFLTWVFFKTLLFFLFFQNKIYSIFCFCLRLFAHCPKTVALVPPSRLFDLTCLTLLGSFLLLLPTPNLMFSFSTPRRLNNNCSI